jgi:hypothetical protein
MTSKEHAGDHIPEGHVQREGRRDTIVQVGRLSPCDVCGRSHEAVYSHEGRFGEGPIYAVVCTDGLTSYYTLDLVVLP